ncbi:hypothetical protein LCGC14_1047390 [marine sediment metagenome]|uniref:Uncharacterized protein n=1 Tax=marine sediment metagenome TaxID=412755 RepID=A0A0F9MUB8_9ZZZZ
MATPTLTGVSDLGKVTTENIGTTTNIVALPIPGSVSEATEGGGFIGAIKTVTITGIIAVTPNNVGTKSQALHAVADQDAKLSPSDLTAGGDREFVSDQVGTLKIIIMSVRTTYDNTSPNILNYVIAMTNVGSRL